MTPDTFIVDAPDKQQFIKGKAYFIDGFLEAPMKQETLILILGDKTVSETKTNLDGDFIFKGSFPSGEYTVRIKGHPYKSPLKFTFKGKSLEGLKLAVIRTKVE